MPRSILLVVILLLVPIAATSALAEDVGSSHVVRQGYSGPLTGPCLSTNQVYRAAGTIPKGPPVQSDWRGFIALYAWATSISGTSYDGGFDTDIDVGFDDILSQLDFAGFGYGEVGYKRWAFGIDTALVGLSKGLAMRDNVLPSVELRQMTLDFRLGYTVFCKDLGTRAWGGCLYPRRLTVEAIAGARYWNVKQTVNLVQAGAPEVSRTSRVTWWDPYVGARVRWPFAKRWSLGLYGDVGGFGLKNASELTWQAQAVLSYHLSRHWALTLGYRALNVDRVEGSGSAREGLDATYHGPLLGVGYIF